MEAQTGWPKEESLRQEPRTPEGIRSSPGVDKHAVYMYQAVKNSQGEESGDHHGVMPQFKYWVYQRHSLDMDKIFQCVNLHIPAEHQGNECVPLMEERDSENGKPRKCSCRMRHKMVPLTESQHESMVAQSPVLWGTVGGYIRKMV